MERQRQRLAKFAQPFEKGTGLRVKSLTFVNDGMCAQRFIGICFRHPHHGGSVATFHYKA